jgi:hypothetical protein
MIPGEQNASAHVGEADSSGRGVGTSVGALTPEEKFELLRMLLERGVEVRTYYRNRRVVAVEKASERYVVIRYESGEPDKLRIATFAKRKFIAVI